MRQAVTRKVIEELSLARLWPRDIIEEFADSYVEAVTTKPLVLLVGSAGTGKMMWTSVVAQALGDAWRAVSARPACDGGKSLFGAYDAFLHRYRRTEALDFTIDALNEFRAHGLAAQRYHLCLCGLRTAVAAPCLAPVLRALETPERQIRLHDQRDELKVGVARTLFLPTNLVIVACIDDMPGGAITHPTEGNLTEGNLAKLALRFPDLHLSPNLFAGGDGRLW